MGNRSSSSHRSSGSSTNSETALPSYRTVIEIDIIHSRTQMGQVQAENAMETLKIIFPNSTVNLHRQSKFNNLVILYDNKKVFDRKKGDGYLTSKNIHHFLSKLTKMIMEHQVKNQRFEIHRTEDQCERV